MFAGRVTPKLPDDELNELLQQLKSITTKQPFITIAAENATWVQAEIHVPRELRRATKGRPAARSAVGHDAGSHEDKVSVSLRVGE